MHEQITFGGTATYDDLGLVIVGEPKLEPPEVKAEMVDVPGGDGSIDLSEFSGDVRYGDREMEFELLLTQRDPQALERERTDLMRTFHGQRAQFTLSWDPGYTYTGRAAFNELPNSYRHSIGKLVVRADPYKYGGRQTWHVNAAGGVAVIIPCGRRRWCPTFQVERETLVSHNGTGWLIPPGTSKVTELYLDPGDNLLVLNTDPDYGSEVLNDYAGSTLADIADQYTRIYAWAAGSSPRQVPLTLNDLAGDTWADYAGMRLIELVHDADSDPSYGVYIQTEIYEL